MHTQGAVYAEGP